jgi:DNA-binding beta-propeller fold protein YncE
MTNHEEWRRLAVLPFVAIGLMLAGCDNGAGPAGTDSSPRDLAMSVAIGEAQFYGTASSGQTVVNADGFHEHDANSGCIRHGSWLFVWESMSTGDLFRYTLDSDNNLSGPQILSFGAGSGPCNVTVISDTKAYVSLFYLGKIAVINPSTMTKTATIDMSSYAAGADGSPEPAHSLARDGLLYVALSQATVDWSSHDTGACVAILDIAADTVQKVIWDDRVNSLSSIDDNLCSFIDENNDIYFYSAGNYGYQPGIKEGFLRIRSGETDFDPSYHFSIATTTMADVAGNAALYGITFCYAGNGIIYTSLQIPALTSETPDYLNDRNCQPAKLDIVNKIITKLPLPPTNGWCQRALCMEPGGTMLYSGNLDGGNVGLFRYDPASGSVTTAPVLTVEGNPYFLFHLEK